MTRVQRLPSPTRIITAVKTCTNQYESDCLETVEQMIEKKHKITAEVRQNTQDRHQTGPKLTQIIKAGGNGLREKSFPSPEELIELLNALEVAFEDQQTAIEEQLAQIEELKELIEG